MRVRVGGGVVGRITPAPTQKPRKKRTWTMKTVTVRNWNAIKKELAAQRRLIKRLQTKFKKNGF